MNHLVGCWIGGQFRTWPLTTIPMASTSLTDELFNRDTSMQVHSVLWRKRSVACPAPHGVLVIDVLVHGFRGSSQAGPLGQYRTEEPP